MSERALIVAAFIVGGAIVATSFPRARYTLSSASTNVVWRMDTWSGQIDICAAVYLPNGPLVRCGVTIVAPAQPSSTPDGSGSGDPQQPAPSQPFAPPAGTSPDRVGLDGVDGRHLL
jgi:hypothetical protein